VQLFTGSLRLFQDICRTKKYRIVRDFCAKFINKLRGGKYGRKQDTRSGKYLEMQQLRQHAGSNHSAGDLSLLQTEMRISKRDLLPARLRLYGHG
jgi:hypothetical protein